MTDEARKVVEERLMTGDAKSVGKQSVDELEITRIVDMLLNGVSRPASRSRHGLRVTDASSQRFQ